MGVRSVLGMQFCFGWQAVSGEVAAVAKVAGLVVEGVTEQPTVLERFIDAFHDTTWASDEHPDRLKRVLDSIMVVVDKELDVWKNQSKMWQGYYGSLRSELAAALGVDNDPAMDLIGILRDRLAETKKP